MSMLLGDKIARSKGIAVLALVFLVSIAKAQNQDDVVMRAMRDELARSMSQLQLPQMERPYFVAYRVQDLVGDQISATLGGLTTSSGPPSHSRLIGVELRVGDYSLDNTNFLSMQRLGGDPMAVFAAIREASLDDNYAQIRRTLWLLTDRQYKRALEDLSAKRAAMKDRAGGDSVPDFSKEPPIQMNAASTVAAPNIGDLEATARDISAIFRSAPDIDRSAVTINYTSVHSRYVNSEGTSFTRSDPLIQLRVTAQTQAVDGQPISDSFLVMVRNPADLPTRDQLRSRTQQLSAFVLKLRSASSLDRYNGPVLFEGPAASEIFLEQFGPRLATSRTPVSDNSQFEMVFSQMFDRLGGSSLQDKIGARVLPEFVSVRDVPSQTEFDGAPLLGVSAIDDDGVRSRETILVDRGVLKNLLASRDPVRGILESTGSRHGWSATPSNIFVTSTKTMTPEELKQELMRRAKDRGLDYALVVRRVGAGSEASFIEMMQQMATGGGSRPSLAEVYKLYPDGHEEPLRGVHLADMSIEAFKEIVATGDRPAVYSDQLMPQMNSIFSVGISSGGELPIVSCVAPSLLFDEVSLAKSEGPFPKAPMLRSPLAPK